MRISLGRVFFLGQQEARRSSSPHAICLLHCVVSAACRRPCLTTWCLVIRTVPASSSKCREQWSGLCLTQRCPLRQDGVVRVGVAMQATVGCDLQVGFSC